jgi:glycyl-tRNA synthetase beta chain
MLERVATPKGEWLVHRSVEAGAPAEQVIREVLPGVVDAIPVPRRMRWGSGDAAFSRPVRWLVVMLDDRVVDCDVLGCTSGRRTMGHRFHGPGEGVLLATAGDYEASLAAAGVVASFDQRRDQVREGILAAAAEAGATALVDADLLDEVTALVEKPVPVLAGFDSTFLELPDEVIIATLQEHQRYFPLTDGDGKLTNQFITIANIDSAEPARVREGNERVVTPRLADAAFFYEADRRHTLESRRPQLERVVFQARLGTLADKSARLEKLAAAFCEALSLPGDGAARAARLAKTDLLTDMVGEFPELQGVMGRYYALADGEAEAVAVAIEEQYLPRFAGDRLPASDAGRALACADRIDTMVGCFAIGARPTGNKDPFGLRRSALGVLRMLIEDEVDLDLRALLRQAAALQPDSAEGADALVAEVEAFLMDRLRGYYEEHGNALAGAPGPDADDSADPGAGDGAGQGVGGGATALKPALAHSVFEAVLAVHPSRPADFDRRLRAVRAFVRLEAAEALAAANKRISNILRQAAEELPGTGVDAKVLAEPAERALHEAVEEVRPQVDAALAAGQYAEALQTLAGLRDAVDRFFDDVMVMAEDAQLRRNRLALLAGLRDLFTRTADISLLQHG